MPAFSIRPTPAADQELISSFRKMIHFHVSMALYSPSHKSSNLLWLQLPNQNLQPCSSQHVKWFPTGKPSLPCDGHNQKLLSKLTTPPLPVLLTTNKTIVPHRAKMMECVYGGFVAADLRTVSILLGCWIQTLGQLPHQTSPRHLPWSPQDNSCWYLGTAWHLRPKSSAPLPNHWPTGFPLQVFPFSFYPSFSKLRNISPHYECCHKGV